jgi:hypothetical protein
MIPLKITIDKAILYRSRDCGIWKDMYGMPIIAPSVSCAIAMAVRDIFPGAIVGKKKMMVPEGDKVYEVLLPKVASEFIVTFDKTGPNQRQDLPEFEFEVLIPDELIESN